MEGKQPALNESFCSKGKALNDADKCFQFT